MNNILSYDVFVFDFDGTIMDTEKFHCKAWNLVLAEFNNSFHINMNYYYKYFHSLDRKLSKDFLKISFNINDYDKIYKRKQEKYKELIETQNIELIPGIENLLNFILSNNKRFVIVSNTSNNFIDIFKIKYPILNNAFKIYTKELFLNKKPNPECYLRVINDFKNDNLIGFEDSLLGIEALTQVNKIKPIYINDSKYYYNEHIINSYENLIIIPNYDIENLNKKLFDNKFSIDYLYTQSFINNILNNNVDQLKKNIPNMKDIIYQVSILLNNINHTNQIYITGMGKSGYVCKKSASTWQSLGIKCSYIDLPNLPHGDFGIFREGDILILISNSGNTDEVVYILNYIKNYFPIKITTISIVANKDSEMEKLSNFTYVLDSIKEGDLINMTPSTSSLIFMNLLDSIGINMKHDIKKEEFQTYHPSGSLGKK
jgi:D-arabinose 5-phosphate isomerase GutQ/beta-phosphoglucomutase-like phosphatase (HAD superfamily)